MTDEQKKQYEEAKEFIGKLLVEYKEKHLKEQEMEELIRDVNIENSDIKGYHGREILELLQNADDAYEKSINEGHKPDCDLEVEISYINSILAISNTGTAFDKDGIKAIVQGNNSPKDGKYIGNKGTGFRSVLNWAEEITILSGPYSVHFSQAQSKELFEEIKNEPQIKKQIEKTKGKGKGDLYVPMLSVPKFIDEEEFHDKTTITVKINPEKIKDDFSVTKQLKEIDLRILLFLPNIKKIKVTTDSFENGKISEILFFKESNEQNNIHSLIKKQNGNEINKEDFSLFTKECKEAVEDSGKKKDVRLSIAVPIDYEKFTETASLYSFFPMQGTKSAFKCVLHATYDLGSNRNSLNNNEKNKEIIKLQLAFIVEVAKKLVDQDDFNRAYKLLMPLKNDGEYFSSTLFNIFPDAQNVYIGNFVRAKLFRLNTNELVSLSDLPKMLEGRYPEILGTQDFPNILKSFENPEFETFIKFAAEKSGLNLDYKSEELKKLIDSVSGKWSIKDQVKVFIWWNEYYFDCLPNLIKKQVGDSRDWISYKEECYFLTGKVEDIIIPKWVQVPVIDLTYQEELFSQMRDNAKVLELMNHNPNDTIDRVLSHNIFKCVDFHYRDKSTIITTVNSSVENRTQALEFVKWLWDYFSGNESDSETPDKKWTPPTETEYNFPADESEIVKSSKNMYFGAAYENEIASEIWGNGYKAFAPMSEIGIDENLKEDFCNFIKLFGVKFFPETKLQQVYPDISDLYKNVLSERLKKLDNEVKNEYARTTNAFFTSITNLRKILKSLKTEQILKWLSSDSSLLNLLKTSINTFNTSVYYRDDLYWNGNKKDKNTSKLPDDYMLYVFNETPWIEINGNRYSPNQILESYNTGSNKDFVEIQPVLSIDYVSQLAQKTNTSIDVVKDILDTFDFCHKITDLSHEEFYSIMLKLPDYPDLERAKKVEKSIFRKIEELDTEKLEKDFEIKKKIKSPSRDKFFNEGKILVTYQGKEQFYPINAKEKKPVCPSVKIVNKRETPIITKGQRHNTKNFNILFKIEDYKSDYKVVLDSKIPSDSSDYDKEFQKYFSEFKKYALAYSESNENIARELPKLNVSLIESIKVIQNNCTEEIKEKYQTIRVSSNFWFITVEHGIKPEYFKLSYCIQTIFENIANSGGFESVKIRELFKANSDTERRSLIEEEFGSLDVLDSKSYGNHIKEKFLEAVKKLKPEYPIDNIEIDFDTFHSMQTVMNIIEFLKNLGVTFKQFNDAGFNYEIQYVTYFKDLTKRIIEKARFQYKNYLFDKATKDVNLQKQFLQDFYNFESFTYDSDIFTPDFDCEKFMIEKFGDWTQVDSSVDCETSYKENYEALNESNSKLESRSNEIANNDELKQWIYFNNKTEVENWLNSNSKPDTPDPDDNDIYEGFRDIIPVEKEIKYRFDISENSSVDDSENEDETEDDENPTMEEESGGNAPKKKKKRNGSFGSKEAIENEKKLKILGNKGELLVYNHLCQLVGKENVYPRSEAFVDLKILKAGQAVSGGYDLSYKDIYSPNQEEIFVEVKTGHSNSFSLSEGELRFAKEHPDNFRIYLVYDVESKNPKYRVLPVRFWEDSKFRQTPIIESYRIEF